MKRLFVLCISLLIYGCSATVPKEVVELSYKMEQDLTQIQATYITLITQHVKFLKNQRQDYLENEWIPEYLESWIEDGQLIGMANGNIEYDEKTDEFKPISKPNKKTQLRGVYLWADGAIFEIQEKRKELIDPLEIAEKKLIKNVNESFSLMLEQNKTITAHLNSIRKVQDVQNDLLSKVKLDGLRDQINSQLSELSDKSSKGLKQIRKIDEKITKYTEK